LWIERDHEEFLAGGLITWEHAASCCVYKEDCVEYIIDRSGCYGPRPRILKS
jgi:hypothetical protein